MVKFEVNRSHPRGVNVHSKFRTFQSGRTAVKLGGNAFEKILQICFLTPKTFVGGGSRGARPDGRPMAVLMN